MLTVNSIVYILKNFTEPTKLLELSQVCKKWYNASRDIFNYLPRATKQDLRFLWFNLTIEIKQTKYNLKAGRHLITILSKNAYTYSVKELISTLKGFDETDLLRIFICAVRYNLVDIINHILDKLSPELIHNNYVLDKKYPESSFDFWLSYPKYTINPKSIFIAACVYSSSNILNILLSFDIPIQHHIVEGIECAYEYNQTHIPSLRLRFLEFFTPPDIIKYICKYLSYSRDLKNINLIEHDLEKIITPDASQIHMIDIIVTSSRFSRDNAEKVTNIYIKNNIRLIQPNHLRIYNHTPDSYEYLFDILYRNPNKLCVDELNYNMYSGHYEYLLTMYNINLIKHIQDKYLTRNQVMKLLNSSVTTYRWACFEDIINMQNFTKDEFLSTNILENLYIKYNNCVDKIRFCISKFDLSDHNIRHAIPPYLYKNIKKAKNKKYEDSIYTSIKMKRFAFLKK
jgi:hypothetical protein